MGVVVVEVGREGGLSGGGVEVRGGEQGGEQGGSLEGVGLGARVAGDSGSGTLDCVAVGQVRVASGLVYYSEVAGRPAPVAHIVACSIARCRIDGASVVIAQGGTIG